MEHTVSMLSEQDRREQRGDPRQYQRGVVDFRFFAIDQAGRAISGQVIDMTIRGCGLRLTKHLTRDQYLTLKVCSNDGTGCVICNVVKVQWSEEDRAGVAFQAISLENDLRRLHRLSGNRLITENKKVWEY